jgi:hypothetical protein
MPEKKFTIDFTDPLAWQYIVTPEVTPEELAEVIAISYMIVQGKVYGPILEEFGHANACERFEAALDAKIEELGKQILQKVKDKHETTLTVKSKAEPLISPLDAFTYGKAIASDIFTSGPQT